MKYKLMSLIIILILFINTTSVFASEKLTFEMESTFPPFCITENGIPTGFTLDLCKMLFSNKDYDIYYKYAVWEKTYEDVKNGKIDSCGLLVITDERKRDILFTKPIIEVCSALYTKKGEPAVTWNSLSSYSGKIGVIKGYFTESMLKQKVSTGYKTYPDEETALNALINGDIKVLFDFQESINYLLIKNNLKNFIVTSESNLFPVSMAFGINKNKPELVNYINYKFDTLVDSGIYEKLYENTFSSHSNIYVKEKNKRMLLYTSLSILAAILAIIAVNRYIRFLKERLLAVNFELFLQHNWLKTTLASIGDAVIACDQNKIITFINYEAQKLTGFSHNECMGKHISDIVFLADESSKNPCIIDFKNISSEKSENEGIMINKNGSKCFVICSSSPIKNDTEDHLGTIFVIKNVTKIKEAELELAKSYKTLEAMHAELSHTEEKLRSQYYELIRSQNELAISEERYKISIEGANDGLWDWHLRESNLFFSPRCYEICGYTPDDIGCKSTNFLKLIHPDSFVTLKRAFKEVIHKKSKYINEEIKILSKNNGYIWLMCRGHAIFDANGKAVRAAGSITDITQMKTSISTIEKMAFTDSLTGLPNRAALVKYIKDKITYTSSHYKFAVLFLDLDNFKAINDTKGHYIGDELLKTAAERLKLAVSTEDYLARLGGDEFMIVKNDICEVDDILPILHNILDNLNSTYYIQNYEINITSSIGVTIFPNDGTNETDLIKNADTAMYKAKEAGKNKYAIFSNDMNEKITKKVELENYLRHAISRKELIVYYQPQIDFKTKEIISMEALLRWQHPKLGMIYPDTFISLAEECGLIESIGEWILRTACAQNKLYGDAGYKFIRIAVNLSPKQFQNRNLYESIVNILNDTGLDPKYLELEITESTALQYYDSAVDTLKKLKAKGITIALDDFGTGYSSLNYLNVLPIDTIKIDKSFIQSITLGGYELNLTKSIISIAHDLNLKVVAEGVETTKQYDMLKDMNCDIAQGYLFSRPIPAQDFEKLLIENVQV